ncbi:large proline-rich protein bag6-B isoform X4 [Drosophila eugracilis]|uniref:large proline-rich protein bag6-B isoform X4 n=1 Tax=Drosophila eugracilis TaxID=29029 RepID=UPI0007E6BE53|nr:large proline-rich protein bag6-B isoform X4 [Drosophila eugracilis]
MLINLKVKTLDARTHEFSIDNELTIRQFKDQIAEKTNIAAENQRIIYQGRVLADEKQVKEYDVDGKVLHVAERPPFSQRGANSRNNDEPMRTFRNVTRPSPPGMRTSPYFRALDGMLVGTMAIPVNNGPVAGTRPTPNRYPNSSSFCINRITVALHMIDCVHNIAAYLENPAVGLHNESLDILQRGRWSMESTVVEVGVSSSDLPGNNNIIDMVQDAVSAALSRTGARNYTVVQLPTVYTNENGETTQQTGEAGTSEEAATGTAIDANGETTAATVIIEDVIETDDEAADGASDRSATPTPEVEAEGAVGGQSVTAAETPSSSNGASNDAAAEGANNSGPRRRTRPQVLAQVIQHYRTVQTRLAPFVDRYYDILQNDPTFEESDTTGREDAQRIFDRVSEAFHYLSHAQHAISDLMLDLSQPGPRVLTCRPILVEQSGYIRSNNIFTPNFLAPPPGLLNDPFRGRAPGAGTQTPTTAGTPTAVTPPQATNLQAANDASRSAAAMAEIASRAAGAAAEMAAGAASAAAAVARGLSSDHVEDPVDDPMVAPNPVAAAPQPQQEQRLEMDHDHNQDQSETPERDIRPVPRLRVYVPVTLPPPNPQLEMARFIQAMVNGQRPNDVHVEFNAPNVMSINLPVHVMAAVRQAPAPGATEAAEPSAPTAESSPESAPTAANERSPNAASTSNGTRGGDQRANTLPTTATQTRSTSRPQIQIGGNNNWGGRIAPTHTAFDRFLPCNSHHIREPEPLPQNINSASTNRGTTTPSTVGTIGGPSTAAGAARSASAGSAVAAVGGSTNPSSGEAATIVSTPSAAPPQAVLSTSTPTPSEDTNNLRSQLLSFLNDSLFAGAPINEQTIPGAIDRALEWFGEILVYLPQYEPSGNRFNSRESMCNVLRNGLGYIFELFSETDSQIGERIDDAQFERRLKERFEIFRRRVSSVLVLCLGGTNSDRYWPRLMSLLRAPIRSNFRNEALQFLCIYIDPIFPDINTGDALQFLVPRDVQAAPPTAIDTNNLRSQLRSFLNDRLFAGAQTASAGSAVAAVGGLTNPSSGEAATISSTTSAAPPQDVLSTSTPTPSEDTNNLRSQLQAAPPIAVDEPFVAPPPLAFNPQVQLPEQQALDTDVEMAEVATSSSNSTPAPQLPAVIVGSEPWHMSFPNDWLPVITRDLQTQFEESNRPQPPFSDAYISGMSAKRRKIIQSEKPTASIECLIANGVERAIQSAGLGGTSGSASNSSISVDAVIGSITHDSAIQASYTDAVRNSVKERIKQDVDFKSSKYPQIAKFAEQK